MASAMEADRAIASDVAALADLRVAQGWARTEALLRALVTWEHGCILVLRERETSGGSPSSALPVAAVSAIAAPPIGVIGNVIVREDFRRQGLSRIVMSAALDWLRLHGAPIVLLDATPDGRPVYERLGFVPVTRSWASWTPISALDMAALDRLSGHQIAQLATAEALPRVVTLDAAAFGGDRAGLLEVMLREPEHQLILATDAHDAVTGYAIARELDGGRQGLRVGPWVAREP
ncbi:MAG TPA: GNAT family N-acetyltransferase, partial [Ktedonobacterales bacterium]